MNVGIIGAGAFGEQHALAIAQHDDIRLVAASRTDGRALAEFTGRYGGRGYTDYHELLADAEVDAVVIATPHHLHTAVVEAAAAAGVHMLLEKPMAPTPSECDRILALVERAGVGLMVGHISHFVPAYRVARELLASGELGGVVHASSVMAKAWMTSTRRDWHLDRASGGGMWLTIGVHVIDQLAWLVGAPVVGVSASLRTSFHRQPADDVGVALLRFQGGVTATATAVGYRTGVTTFLTELSCEAGMLRIDHRRGVFVGRDERWQPVPGSAARDWMADALVAEWRAFADALDQRAEMPVTGAYARHVMAVAFAAEASSRRGREVEVS